MPRGLQVWWNYRERLSRTERVRPAPSWAPASAPRPGRVTGSKRSASNSKMHTPFGQALPGLQQGMISRNLEKNLVISGNELRKIFYTHWHFYSLISFLFEDINNHLWNLLISHLSKSFHLPFLVVPVLNIVSCHWATEIQPPSDTTDGNNWQFLGISLNI